MYIYTIKVLGLKYFDLSVKKNMYFEQIFKTH